MYESWFRFRRRPFAAAPRVDDYYPAETSESARKSLIACVQRGAGPGLLIGSAGSGKSTLCHQLLSHFRTRTAVALVSCSGLAARRTLFQNILFELGRPYRDLDEGELRLSLVDYLTSRDASNSGTVLLFDDAHHLNVELFEDLRMLSSMVRDGHWCVHVVLSGNVRLEEILSVPNLESLNQRIAARCYLEPFRSNETAAYVRRQFERAEGDADTVFIAGAQTAIHKCSGGTPRLINQLCDHALLLAATGSRSQLDEHGILEAWSDLQHLPPPERETESRASADEFVEFGALDQETLADTTAEIAVTERVEGAESNREPQQPLCEKSPQTSSPFETVTAETNEPSSHAPEIEVDTQVQFHDAESFDLEPIEADRFEVEPMGAEQIDADQIDAEKCLDVIEAHLNRYDDDARPPTTENPFLEDFVEEEVIVDRPTSLLNRVANCQPPVTSRHGQELQTALDHISLAAVKGQPWQLASEIGSPRILVSPVDSVDDAENTDESRAPGNAVVDVADGDNEFSDSSASEHAGTGVRSVEEAAGDAALEHVADFSVSEVAVREVAVSEASVPELTVAEVVVSELAVLEDTVAEDTVAEDTVAEDTVAEDTVAEDTVAEDANVSENSAIEVAVHDDVACDTADCEEVVSEDAATELAVSVDVAHNAPAEDDVGHLPSSSSPDSTDFGIEADSPTFDVEPALAPSSDDLPSMERAVERVAVEESAEQADASASELDEAIHNGQQDETETALDNCGFGVESDNTVDDSNVAFEMHAYRSTNKLDVTQPTVGNDEGVEVFEVEFSEHPSASLDDFVAQYDTESLPECGPKSSPGEIHPTDEAIKNDREPLPRNAKPGRRLNRLFSNLVDR